MISMKALATGIALLCTAWGAVAQRNYSREVYVNNLDSLVYLIEDVEVDPYAQLDKATFYAAIDSAKRSVTADSLSIFEIYRTVARLTGMFNQGHLLTRMPDDVGAMLAESCLPVGNIIKVNADRTLTIDCDSVMQKQRLMKGDVIESINGHPTAEIMEKTLALIPGELPSYRLHGLQEAFGMYYNMIYPNENTFKLKIKRADKSHNLSLSGVKYQPRSKRITEPYSYRALNDSVYLFEFNSCDMNNIEYFMRQMVDSLNRAGAAHLIIDVRHNGGGNSRAGDEVCRYITPKAFSGFERTFTKNSITTSEYYGTEFTDNTVQEFTVDELDKSLPYAEDYRFKGKTYLLQGPETFSSGANFTAAYKEYVPGLIIGEETGGANICVGDVIGKKLPETQLIIILPWKIFYNAGSKPGDAIHGTIPDVVVSADRALDKALEIITGK